MIRNWSQNLLILLDYDEFRRIEVLIVAKLGWFDRKVMNFYEWNLNEFDMKFGI